MLTLDEFLEHIATSGLIPAAKLEQAWAQLDPGRAGAVSLRLVKRLIGQGLLKADQGRKLRERLTVESKTRYRTMAFSLGEKVAVGRMGGCPGLLLQSMEQPRGRRDRRDRLL